MGWGHGADPAVAEGVAVGALGAEVGLWVGGEAVGGEQHAGALRGHEVVRLALSAAGREGGEAVGVAELADSVGVDSEVGHAASAGVAARGETVLVDAGAVGQLQVVLAAEAVAVSGYAVGQAERGYLGASVGDDVVASCAGEALSDIDRIGYGAIGDVWGGSCCCSEA